MYSLVNLSYQTLRKCQILIHTQAILFNWQSSLYLKRNVDGKCTCNVLGNNNPTWQSFSVNIKWALSVEHSWEEIKSPHSLCQASCLVWEYLSVSVSQYAPLLCCRLYVNGPQACPRLLVFQMTSTVTWEGCMQAKRQLPCASCQQRVSNHETYAHYQSWACYVSSLCEQSMLPSSVLLSCVYFSDSYSKMKWAKAFEFTPGIS